MTLSIQCWFQIISDWFQIISGISDFILIPISIVAIIGVVSRIRTSMRRKSIRCAVERIAATHKNGLSLVKKLEINHSIKHYIQQHFYIHHDKSFLNTNGIVKKIERSTSEPHQWLFCITGEPGSGKSAALRYVFSKLNKEYACFYFPLRTILSVEALGYEIARQKEEIDMDFLSADYESAPVAFFDGVDEAAGLLSEVDFEKLFLANDAKVYELFRDKGVNPPVLVMSIRHEILSKGIETIKKMHRGNARVVIYKIRKLGSSLKRKGYVPDKKRRDVFKMYNSLRLLQKAERKAEKGNAYAQIRHFDRFPPFRERNATRAFLRNALQQTEDSIFLYPVFIRYVYIVFKAVTESNLNNLNKKPSSGDFYSAFHLIIEAIVKWEYHVYSTKGAVVNRSTDGGVIEYSEEYLEFKSILLKILNTVAMHILNGEERITRIELEELLSEHFSESDIVNLTISIAHTLLVSDENGNTFTFVHNSFYEYFAALYLYECTCTQDGGDVCDCLAKRSKHLKRDLNDGISMHYISYLCNDNDIFPKFAQCLGYDSNLRSSALCDLVYTGNPVAITDKPDLQLVEIYKRLPIIMKFEYRGKIYTDEEICALINGKGKLDFSRTGWRLLQDIDYIAPFNAITYMDLRRCSIDDVDTISRFDNLECLDIRHAKPVLESWIQALMASTLHLKWLYVYITTESEVTYIYDENKKTTFAEKIFFDIPPFNNAYIKLYEIFEQATANGSNSMFSLNSCTPKSDAENRFENPRASDIPLMKAVFELEYNRFGSSSTPTLWNGLTLARCYEDEDWTDIKKTARNIYSRLENGHFTKADKRNKLGVYFSYYNGANFKHLVNSDYHNSKKWLYYAYTNARDRVSSTFEFICGSQLVRVCANIGDDESFNQANALIPKLLRIAYTAGISKSDPTRMDLMRYRIGIALKEKAKNISKKYKSLQNYARWYLNHAKEYAEVHKVGDDATVENQFYVFDAYYYLSVVHIIEEDYCNALNIVNIMRTIIEEKAYSGSQSDSHAMALRHSQQRMVTLFLLEQYKEAKTEAQEHLAYPYRITEKSPNAAMYIVCSCDNNNTELDAHPEYKEQFESIISGERLWL